MKRNFGFCLLFLAAFTFLSSQSLLAKEIKPAPDFELQDLYQDLFKLSSYKNKQAVVLFFWTTWCPFCQKELRVLNDRYAGIINDGLEVLSVNVGERPDTVDNFTKSYRLSYRVLLDKDSTVFDSYGLQGVPTYVLVDKDGGIVFQGNYFPNKEYQDLISVKK